MGSQVRWWLFIGLLVPLQAHDIVTTGVTWDREISRIVYARCASCHRAGGTAFSLMTYQAARPWAAAIKADVLQRRMPPWGAVKGFGEFRNDQALTAEQLEFITSWTEGGVPEGDARDLSPAPKFDQTPPSPDLRGAQLVGGTARLARSIVLGGLLPQKTPVNSSMKILAQLPDGSLRPLLWLRNYDERHPHVFLLRYPITLPSGTLVRGLAEGAGILLIPADSTARR